MPGGDQVEHPCHLIVTPAGNDACAPGAPHRVETPDIYRVVPREQCVSLVIRDIC
jgi:hypothetical protein